MKDDLVLQDVQNDPIGENWMDKSDAKLRAFSIHSPGLHPRMLYESPALGPKQAPSYTHQQDEVPSFFGKRKPSVLSEANEAMIGRKGTDDGIDFRDVSQRNKYERRERIIPICDTKEERDQEKLQENEDENIDCDGFKRPKEIKPHERAKGEQHDQAKAFKGQDESNSKKTDRKLSNDCETNAQKGADARIQTPEMKSINEQFSEERQDERQEGNPAPQNGSQNSHSPFAESYSKKQGGNISQPSPLLFGSPLLQDTISYQENPKSKQQN
jgi:hypothetical protein